MSGYNDVEYVKRTGSSGRSAILLRVVVIAIAVCAPASGQSPGIFNMMEPDVLPRPGDGDGPTVGDPVYAVNGEVRIQNTDLTVRSVGFDFAFVRYYRSAPSGNVYDGPLGKNWDFNYNMHLFQSQTSGNSNIESYNGAYRKYTYTYNSTSEVWTAPAGVFDTISLSGSAYTRTTARGVKYHYTQIVGLTDRYGRLAKMEDRNGNSMTFYYDASDATGKLTKITDTNGRDFTLSYGADKRISEIADFGATARKIKYEYSASGDLTKITELPTETGLERSTTYSYSSHRVVTITDPKENAKSTPVPFCRNYYDATTGRLIAQEYGPDASDQNPSTPTSNAFLLAYEPTSGAVTKTIHTDREGTVINFYFDTNGLMVTKEWDIAGSSDPAVTYEYDNDYNITLVTNVAGDRLEYEHDDSGNVLTARTTRAGETALETTYEYDGALNLVTKIIDRAQRQTDITYDAKGNVITVAVDPSDENLITEYSYDSANNYLLEWKIDPNGTKTTYQYDANGYLTSVKGDDESGGLQITLAEFVYDEFGNIVTTKDANGNETVYTVNRLNQVTKLEDPLGHEMEIVYDESDNVVTTYADNGEGAGSSGHVVTMEYDILNNLIEITEDIDSSASASRITSFAHDLDEKLTKVTYPEGNVLEYEYDERDRHTKTVVGSGASEEVEWVYYWDDDSRLTKIEEPLGSSYYTEYYRDYHGRVTKIENAKGHYVAYDFGETDLLQSVEFYESGTSSDPYSRTKYLYDSASRITKSEVMLKDAPGGTNIGDGKIVATVTYDDNGNVVTVTDDAGNDTRFEYDALSRLTVATDDIGNEIEFTYDDNGNVVTFVEEEVQHGEPGSDTYTFRLEYDALDRVTKVWDPADEAVSLTYDEMGNVLTAEDPGGSKSFFDYDELNRMVARRVQYDGSSQLTTEWFYDDNGNLLTLRDPRGKDTKFAYDALDRVTTETFADGHERLYTYDDNSNLVTREDQNATKIYYAYDELNRLTRKTYSVTASHIHGETSQKDFYYDVLNRLTKAEDTDSRVIYTFNTANLIESEEMQYGSQNKSSNTGRSVDWSYDGSGRVSTVTYPGATASNGRLNYTYDALNRVSTITRQTGSSSTEDIVEWVYRGTRVIKKLYGNGTFCDVTYDSRKLVTSVVHQREAGSTDEKIVQCDYEYDDAGTVTGEGVVHFDDSGVQVDDKGYRYYFDKANRLTKYYEGVPAAQIDDDPPSTYVDKLEYTLDANSNRVTVTATASGGSPVDEVYAVNDTNEYTEVVLGATTTSYTYDDAGNRKSVGAVRTWYYDYQNRLVQVKQDADNYVEYHHDALGRRMEKKWNWDGTEYAQHKRFYFAGSRLIQEYDLGDDDPVLEFEYLWGRDVLEPVQVRKYDILSENPPELEAAAYYHQNQYGSVYALSEDSQAAPIVENYRYLVYGGATIYGGDTTSPATPFGNKFLWHARYYDLEVEDVASGQRLYGDEARAYDPSIGASLSRDPALSVGSRHEANPAESRFGEDAAGSAGGVGAAIGIAPEAGEMRFRPYFGSKGKVDPGPLPGTVYSNPGSAGRPPAPPPPPRPKGGSNPNPGGGPAPVPVPVESNSEEETSMGDPPQEDPGRRIWAADIELALLRVEQFFQRMFDHHVNNPVTNERQVERTGSSAPDWYRVPMYGPGGQAVDWLRSLFWDFEKSWIENIKELAKETAIGILLGGVGAAVFRTARYAYRAYGRLGFRLGDRIKGWATKMYNRMSLRRRSPYGHLSDDKYKVAPGRRFSDGQRKKILDENRRKNGGVLRDDVTGELLVPSTPYTKGSKHAFNEAHVDHIVPMSKGGSNSFKNAAVRARGHNAKKFNKHEVYRGERGGGGGGNGQQ